MPIHPFDRKGSKQAYRTAVRDHQSPSAWRGRSVSQEALPSPFAGFGNSSNDGGDGGANGDGRGPADRFDNWDPMAARPATSHVKGRGDGSADSNGGPKVSEKELAMATTDRIEVIVMY